MSQQHIEKVTCPKCGASGEITIWDSINVDQDPELKNKILDESLFIWECPHCKHRVYVTFGTLYHDMNNQFMIFFDHKTNDNDISEDEFPANPEFERFNKNYKLRYVHGINNLKEKIFIFEEHLSDVVIELIKYFIRNNIIIVKKDDPNYFIGKGIFFTNLSQDGEQLVFSVTSPEGGVENHLAISMNVYEQCLQKMVLDERFKSEKNAIKNVCYDWIDARLKA